MNKIRKKTSVSSRVLSRQLHKWLGRLYLSSDILLILLALVVGLCTGVGAIIFRYLIDGVVWLGYEWAPEHLSFLGNYYVIIVPTIGGLIVGPLIYFFAREAKGHGVPEVMEAVALHGGRIRPRVAIIKSLASSVSIGTGGSVGREGPIVQIGSAIGSTLGQLFRLSDTRIRALVACGAAGGIAATFNAPIAGVLFALEVIISEFNIRYFSTVVISSVTASVIGRLVFGNEPAFSIPTEYGVHSTLEYLFYPLLGILAALAGVAFIRMLYWTEDRFNDWKAVPEWGKPAIGGIMLGLLAIGYPLITGITWSEQPQIYNVGYEVIEQALANQLTLVTVSVLFILKMFATSITLGSGGSGGVFAPSLFVGAMLGSTFATVVNIFMPGITAPAGAYALVGMAGVFAAIAQAPITAVIILFELTADYRLILPLMLTVVIAALMARKLTKGESIYTLKLSRRGVRLQHGRDQDVLQGVTVGEVMSTSVETLSTGATLAELSQRFQETRHHGIVIMDDQENLWGIVSVTDLSRAISDSVPETTKITKIGTPRDALVVTFTDETMGEALKKMGIHGVGRLPVVDYRNPNRLLGIIRRPEITRAYRLGLSKRAEMQERNKQLQLRNIDDTVFKEFTLHKGDSAIGKSVKELARTLPNDCILISIRRNDEVFMPHGDTIFQVNDKITAYLRQGNIDTLKQCLGKNKQESTLSEQ